VAQELVREVLVQEGLLGKTELALLQHQETMSYHRKQMGCHTRALGLELVEGLHRRAAELEQVEWREEGCGDRILSQILMQNN
jgi:hypothetical protein